MNTFDQWLKNQQALIGKSMIGIFVFHGRNIFV